MVNLIMEKLEQRTLSTSHVQPWFWKRMVDDVCAAGFEQLQYQSRLKATPDHWLLISQVERSRPKRSSARCNLFHSMQRLRGDQTEIHYSVQRTPKSSQTKTSQEIHTRRTLFTIWSRCLVGIVYNITYQHKLAKPTPLRGLGN